MIRVIMVIRVIRVIRLIRLIRATKKTICAYWNRMPAVGTLGFLPRSGSASQARYSVIRVIWDALALRATMRRWRLGCQPSLAFGCQLSLALGCQFSLALG